MFEGEFLKGLKHGYGKIIYPSGNTYEGLWERDMKEGKGIMSWETLMERVSYLYKYIIGSFLLKV